MYESEVDGHTVDASEIPSEVRDRFRDAVDAVATRTILPWGEHCTECAMPSCFETCALYAARPDGKCRRFTNGVERVVGTGGIGPYVLKISFRRWGQLHAIGNTHLFPAPEAARIERRDVRTAGILHALPLPATLRRRVTRWRSRSKSDAARELARGPGSPDSFLLEVYNPNEQTIHLTFTVRPKTDSPVPFQERLALEPGFTRHRIAVARISARVDLSRSFVIDLLPNEVPEGTTLYFGAMDFVTEPSRTTSTGKPCKCVVWDLDNTVWEGILVEDGIDGLVLRPGIEDVFRRLDERGILHSVVSKNDPEPAMAALERFGLAEYVLVPQISWDPKGAMVARVADALNIGRDTLLFIDDSPFERAEVASVCPEVRILDATEYATLPDRPECRVPVTEDSRRRRQLYREQAVRAEAAVGFGDDYFEFLRECNLELTLSPLGPENIARVHELTQRTNQMNFSGRRYTVDELRELGESPDHDTYVMRCRDRFGDYGTVGFACIDVREPRLLDLTFSCRVQSKRVEHAFLTEVLRRYLPDANPGLLVSYKRTDRNAPSGRVFDDFGMERIRFDADGTETLLFERSREIPDDAFVRISETNVIRT